MDNYLLPVPTKSLIFLGRQCNNPTYKCYPKLGNKKCMSKCSCSVCHV